jgi:hypothetical protein
LFTTKTCDLHQAGLERLNGVAGLGHEDHDRRAAARAMSLTRPTPTVSIRMRSNIRIETSARLVAEEVRRATAGGGERM